MPLKSRVKQVLRRAAGRTEPSVPPPAAKASQAEEEASSPPEPQRHSPERFVHLLACPRCRTGLRLEGDHLACTGCARIYELVEGVPVLLPDPHDVRVMPLDHQSNAVSPQHVEWLSSFDGFTLNIGAGATTFKLPRCLELEYSIFRTTDLVGDAHRLPFTSDAFDAVITMNTFEHLSDPELAASEVRRVLRPGGRLLLQTAFLQPLHEPPFHFYNTTEFGLRRWFRDFDIDSCAVPSNMNPAYPLAWQCCELLYHLDRELGQETRRLLSSMTLEEFGRWWADPASRQGPAWDAMMALPQDSQRYLSGGFELAAHKPRE